MKKEAFKPPFFFYPQRLIKNMKSRDLPKMKEVY